MSILSIFIGHSGNRLCTSTLCIQHQSTTSRHISLDPSAHGGPLFTRDLKIRFSEIGSDDPFHGPTNKTGYSSPLGVAKICFQFVSPFLITSSVFARKSLLWALGLLLR